jgi:hypothetical protein
MKRRQTLRVASVLVGVVLLAVFVGCRTRTYDRGDAAARSLQQAAMEVQVQSRYLTFTMSALDDLVSRPRADLRPQFEQFSRNLDRLQDSARRNEKAARAAYERNAAYLGSWDRQITNMNYEVVRSRSEDRRKEVTNKFNAVNERYAEGMTVMEPLLSYLSVFLRALGSVLTLGGMVYIKPVVANAADNARKVEIALSKLTNQLADSGARMSSIGDQTPASGSTNDAQRQKATGR